MMLLKCCTQYVSKFGKCIVSTRLKKVSFHSSVKDRQCQRMFKLPYSCAHFTCQQGYAQNPSSQVLAVRELRAYKCTSWIQKRLRNQRSNCQHLLHHKKSKGIAKKISNSASLTTLKPLAAWITTNYGIFLKKNWNIRSPYLPSE